MCFLAPEAMDRFIVMGNGQNGISSLHKLGETMIHLSQPSRDMLVI